MDFQLTPTQTMIQQMVRDFAVNEVKPLAAYTDETAQFPRTTVEQMQRYGLLGMNVPVQFGGGGADEISYAIAVEEISKVCATTGVILSAHNSLFCDPLVQFGTTNQQETYLRPAASGEKLGAFALTEPNAGTDAASQVSRAQAVEGGYVLNGSKIFITNGGEADFYIIFAMTDASKGTRGISAFILEKGWQGFEFGRLEEKMGIHGSSTRELIFKDVFVPQQNLLGEEGKGFKIAMITLDGGRIGIAAQAVGIAQGALDETVVYIKQREQFKQPIAKFQAVQFTVADMETQTSAARLLTYQAADAKKRGLPYSKLAAMAKLFASETASYVASKAVQLHGGYGYTKEYPVERMMRDAKITEIYEGTSEVQRMVIAANVIG
ncbi:MAG TPA: acyl-CoA dehydrogenase [Chloroflexi bacterium]|nr:acyl-CoA dehydrogenase [Chloroflexota bacterium]